ncbi:MAG: hypothetical protein A3I05_09820 [Deltaproteobacteria bacterium RIFCSPLOWO2_02_FULL_44_10]|nr:MAG: hypothetical protein A3I05_09820 [Deltaproteobacteria bacterium RIFCSPLOWO2_02_FULL_44_10]
MLQALKLLDSRLPKKVTMLIGGGSAMLLAHDVPLTTADIDGLPLSTDLSPAELDNIVKDVGQELKIGGQWYNSYFSTFTYSLPKDFRDRLITVYKGKMLHALALGAEDILIMKCFAGREKDIGHAKALIKRGADTDLVEHQLDNLQGKGLPGAENALDFLHDLLDQLEV